MKTEKRFKKDFAGIKTPTIENVLGTVPEKRSPRRIPMKFATVLTCIILASLLVVGGMAAGTVAIIKNLNAPVLLGDNIHATTVPQGFTGLYTAADLAAVSVNGNQDRNRYNGNSYILMNDIELTDADYAKGGVLENGWKPVNVSDFFGNGYVIRNLKVNAFVNDSYSEYCSYTGIFTSAYNIRNLGIENCEISITSDYPVVAGGIVGSAYTVYGCYASDVRLNITVNGASFSSLYDEDMNSYVGGICGKASYLDSCWSDAEINVTGKNSEHVASYIGGLSASSFSVVTSYFNGKINAAGFGMNHTGSITPDNVPSGVAVLMTKQTYDLMFAKVVEKFPSKDATKPFDLENGSFEAKKIAAYFVLKDPSKAVSQREHDEMINALNSILSTNAFTFDEKDASAAWYLFEPMASPHMIADISTVISEAFGSYQAFVDFCREQNIKCGLTYCYSSDETEFDGFDFVNVWQNNKDGKPTLRSFN